MSALPVSCTMAAFLWLALAPVPGTATAQSKPPTAPEAFRAKARVTTATAAGDALVTIELDTYTPESDLKTMEQALESGGSAAFVEALRRAPVAGRFRLGDQTFTIRWARQQPTPSGRVITLVTDAPVYFVGGGVPGAKPRAGFDLAVVQLKMDAAGVGEGTLAAAARVKRGGLTGVEVEDYATEPIKLVSVFRVLS